MILVNKFSAQNGVISPLVIGGVVVIGIIVLLVASGSLKFSGYIKTDSNQTSLSRGDKSQESQESAQVPEATARSTEQSKSEVKLSSEPFTDSKLGFSISYPEGWKVKSATNNVNIYKPSDTKSGDQADAMVSIVAGDIGELKDSKVATIADLHKVYIKKQFSNVEFTGEKEVQINSQDGYQLEFTGTVNSQNMQAKYIVLKGEKNLFALVEVANIGMWKDLEKELDASVQTFKIQ